ncbi:hypothetical protein GCM10012275_38240 [Longimycelium tulufanense]|uniref:Uncharacterized protein n=1 Tax=Longimycelium tulufanense TaxID=907463 RepID=A0A8J3FV10_9PSEU|nr:hypothetical protein [Longimycelium tulufanense]GGM64077.1 hypothetical protein GCM10012275_38240 [Longimycelium tulufanense]
MIQFRLGERTWPWDGDVSIDEIIAAEKAVGRLWNDLNLAAKMGEGEATKVFFWLARRRAGEDIAYKDLNFKLVDFAVEDVDAESDENDASEPPPGPTGAAGASTAAAHPHSKKK